MIKFVDICESEPYQLLKKLYEKAQKKNQKNIEAFVVSSFSRKRDEVFSRYLNLKSVQKKEFIFFTNYLSPKAKQFREHNQISCLIFWNQINAQIRLQGKVKKIPHSYNKKYFKQRDPYKNALAISSRQSKKVSEYNAVVKNYEKIFHQEDLTECPDYWGGYAFTPYYFEFWEGHSSRINKREVYELKNDSWTHFYIQP